MVLLIGNFVNHFNSNFFYWLSVKDLWKNCTAWNLLKSYFFRKNMCTFFFLFFFYVRYSTLTQIQTSDSTVSEDAGIEPKTFVTLARRYNRSARSHPLNWGWNLLPMNGGPMTEAMPWKSSRRPKAFVSLEVHNNIIDGVKAISIVRYYFAMDHHCTIESNKNGTIFAPKTQFNCQRKKRLIRPNPC
jgi:hypothetical protein